MTDSKPPAKVSHIQCFGTKIRKIRPVVKAEGEQRILPGAWCRRNFAGGEGASDNGNYSKAACLVLGTKFFM